MACFHPILAYQSPSGEIHIGKDAADTHQLRLPCGGCLGCRMARAKEWTLRCTLELQKHDSAIFTTLTYNAQTLPATLTPSHLSLWLKRLRREVGKRRIRFFASGEYGEENNRPHYHAILYGLSERDGQMVETTWGKGFAQTKPINPARIAYVAGYNSKKIGYKRNDHEERVDPDTGELYTWQPPFILMSRNPGIGGHARAWPLSWRNMAILNGQRMPVPRFLHESWKQQATEDEKEKLKIEKEQQQLLRDTTTERLRDKEKIAAKQHSLTAEKRGL